MKLHHTDGRADWARIPSNRRNVWQRVAVATHGLLTIGNLVSLVGLSMVCVGACLLLTHHATMGIWWIVFGRICDVADGIAADHTGTKSPFGGAVDAAFDKLGALAVLLAVGFGHITPWWAVGIIALQNATNVLIAYLGLRWKIVLEPVLTGKLSTALQWISLASFMIAHAYSSVWLWPAYLMFALAMLLGCMSTATYVRLLRTLPRRAPDRN